MKNDPTYALLLGNIKSAISTAQQQAVMELNSSLLLAYWQVGNLILTEQSKQGWGAKKDPANASISPQELQKKYPDFTSLVASMKIVNTTLTNYSLELDKLIKGK